MNFIFKILAIAIFTLTIYQANAQKIVADNPEVIPSTYHGLTKQIKNLTEADTMKINIPNRTRKLGYHPKNDWFLHQTTNPNALPLGADPAWQKSYSIRRGPDQNTIRNWEGLGFTGVNPPDPSMDVGPNHVIQMINGSGGALVSIYDKQGNQLSTFVMDGISNISGAGDPIVVYDHMADRWLLTEFGPRGADVLIVLVSQTPDPQGAWHIYSFGTPNFPDYPKYGLWPNMYVVTTNESDAQAVYAMDRVKMLAGDPTATMQRFADLDKFQTLGFQAATPVNISGTSLPAQDAPALIMRIADDGWDNVDQDRLEMYELNVDFDTPASSNLVASQNVITQPFDTELCGYTSFSCITQPQGGAPLDPLREVLMNKIHLRRFADYDALVCTHVTDVDGNDRAGVRWYELRRPSSGGAWTIHQQGTYAPTSDSDSRWMSAIAINEDGSIGLAYNVSSSTVFPSLRYTGRTFCDPLGEMTIPETSIVEGTSANGSNRYGDYNDMNVDPVNGSFWFTGEYNTASAWSTYVSNFEVPLLCNTFRLTTDQSSFTICPGDTDLEIEISAAFFGEFNDEVTFSTGTLPSGLSGVFTPGTLDTSGTVTLTLTESGLAPGTYSIDIAASGGAESDNLTIELIHWESLPSTVALSSPDDGAVKVDVGGSLTWMDAIDQTGYRLEVSTDPAFQNIVISEDLTTASFDYSGLLEPATVYYWRVTAFNDCGDAETSEVRSFRTQKLIETCQTIMGTEIGLDILDNQTVTSQLSSNLLGIISSVEVKIDVTHTFSGDLGVDLMSPASTNVLFSRSCSADDDIKVTFSDGGIELPCPAVTSSPVSPNTPLANHNGGPAAGDWILSIADNASQDQGTLNAWSITLCALLPAPDCTSVVDVDGDIPSGTYHYATQLSSQGTVKADSAIVFKAGKQILLNQNFNVEQQGVLEAIIQDCEEID